MFKQLGLALFVYSGRASCLVAWEEQLTRYQLASVSPRTSHLHPLWPPYTTCLLPSY